MELFNSSSVKRSNIKLSKVEILIMIAECCLNSACYFGSLDVVYVGFCKVDLFSD